MRSYSHAIARPVSRRLSRMYLLVCNRVLILPLYLLFLFSYYRCGCGVFAPTSTCALAHSSPRKNWWFTHRSAQIDRRSGLDPHLRYVVNYATDCVGGTSQREEGGVTFTGGRVCCMLVSYANKWCIYVMYVFLTYLRRLTTATALLLCLTHYLPCLALHCIAA